MSAVLPRQHSGFLCLHGRLSLLRRIIIITITILCVVCVCIVKLVPSFDFYMGSRTQTQSKGVHLCAQHLSPWGCLPQRLYHLISATLAD